jgi:hypothetical protein
MSNPVERDKAFKKTMGAELPNSLLGTALDFIRDHMNPDEVFDQSRLNSFVGNTALPEEVFREDELIKWAAEKGYTKQDKQPYRQLTF